MSEHAEHTASSYVKTWGILLVLFVISILGPELGIRWVTIITAFGIALVKAYLVAVHFMHINLERRYVVYIMLTMVLMMLLFWAGIVVDIGEPSGSNWIRSIEIN